MPDRERPRRDRLDGFEERRPFRERRKVRDDTKDDVGRGGDGDRGVNGAVSGVRVVCHGGDGNEVVGKMWTIAQ